MKTFHGELKAETTNVLESISDGFIGLDREFRLTYANSEAERIIGIPRAELFPGVYWRTFSEALGPTVAGAFRQAMIERTTLKFEHYHEPLQRWFDVAIFPANDGGLAVYFRDVTERKRADEAVRRSNERLRLATQVGKVGIWEWDIASNRISWSDSLYAIHGVQPETFDATLEGFTALVHPEDAERVSAAIQQALANEAPYELEMRTIRPDGEVISLFTNATVLRDGGRPVRMLGATVDISQLKRAEAALRTSETQFRTLANVIPQLAWMARPDGYVFWYNQRWYDYTGTTLEQVQGWGWQSVHDPAELPRVVEKIQRSFATGEPWEDTFMLRRHDGEMRWHLSRMMPVRDNRDRIVMWFGINTDITEQREADRRKDEFLATLAHELRNPLAPLQSGIEVMKLADTNLEAVEQARAMMDRQVHHMVRLIDDLLDVSRISRGNVQLRRECVDLAVVVRSALETSRPLLEQYGHVLTLTVPPDPIFVDADVTRLAQVFANLLNNAVKYTPRGSEVRLLIERHGTDVDVVVKDDGIGIPSHMLPKVFEMFTQVNPSLEKGQGGLGIGLTIVKRLVEMHGGTVEAHSEGPGRGSEFVVRLPIAHTVCEQHQSADAQSRSPNGRRRILVVDDNCDSATSLALLLDLMGNETQTAHDGLEAMDVASTFRPHIILLDIGMPKLNGYDTCRRIRAEPWGRNTVVAALTGWGQPEDRGRSHEAGFDHHLVKPLDITALEKLLDEAP